MEQQTPQNPEQPQGNPQPQAAPQTPAQPNVGPTPNGLKPPTPKKSNKLPLIIGLAAAGFFMLICALVAIWFLFLRGPKVLEYDRGTIVSEYVDLTKSPDDNTRRIRDARQLGNRNDVLKFALYWDFNEDIDLMVVQPNNTEVYYLNTFDHSTRARLEEDAVSGEDSPEYITIGRPEAGKYDVFVRVPELSHSENVTLVVMDRDEYKSYDIEIKPAKKDNEYVAYYLLASLDFDGDYTYVAPEPERNDYYAGNTVNEYWEMDWETVADDDAVMRARALPGSNRLKIALFWDTSADLDLIVNTASGEDLYYGDRSARGGGSHSGDDYGHGQGSKEYAYWSNPQAGLYDIFVRSMSLNGNTEIPVTVVVINDGDPVVYKADIFKPNGAGYSVTFKVAGIYVN